jgi:hypothetical protein
MYYVPLKIYTLFISNYKTFLDFLHTAFVIYLDIVYISKAIYLGKSKGLAIWKDEVLPASILNYKLDYPFLELKAC